MNRRNILFSFFMLGGVLSLCAIFILQEMAKNIAGMGATYHKASTMEVFISNTIAALVALYFLISAFGLRSTRDRKTLHRIAVVAHLCLLPFAILFCYPNHGYENELYLNCSRFFSLIIPCFSPWLLIWCFILFRSK